jgi:hypothetical protein
VSAVQEASLLAALGQAQAEREALDRGHAVAFRENPTVRRALERDAIRICTAAVRSNRGRR